MSKKFLVDKIASKLNKKGLVYIQKTKSDSVNNGYETNLETVPEKYKSKAFSNIETAFLDEENNELSIVCASIFIPYAENVKIMYIDSYDSENIVVHIEITDTEVKYISSEMNKYE